MCWHTSIILEKCQTFDKSYQNPLGILLLVHHFILGAYHGSLLWVSILGPLLHAIGETVRNVSWVSLKCIVLSTFLPPYSLPPTLHFNHVPSILWQSKSRFHVAAGVVKREAQRIAGLKQRERTPGSEILKNICTFLVSYFDFGTPCRR